MNRPSAVSVTAHLNPGVGFDDAAQVLLQHGVVQCVEVRLDDGVAGELSAEVGERLTRTRTQTPRFSQGQRTAEPDRHIQYTAHTPVAL